MTEKSTNKEVYKVFAIDKCICNYLSEVILSKESNRYYADKANISEYVIRKIKHPLGYRIPISTLKKITDSLDLSLASLIEIVEKEYKKDLKQEFLYFIEIDDSSFKKLSNKEIKNIQKLQL